MVTLLTVVRAARSSVLMKLPAAVLSNSRSSPLAGRTLSAPVVTFRQFVFPAAFVAHLLSTSPTHATTAGAVRSSSPTSRGRTTHGLPAGAAAGVFGRRLRESVMVVPS